MARGDTGSGIYLRERFCKPLRKRGIAIILKQRDHRSRCSNRRQFKARARNARAASLALPTHPLGQRRAGCGIHRSE